MNAKDTAWKYQGENPLERLHKGEPYFFIRAQDKLSPEAVKAYSELLKRESDTQRKVGNDNKADHLLKQAIGLFIVIDRFNTWQEEHQDLVKLPD